MEDKQQDSYFDSPTFREDVALVEYFISTYNLLSHKDIIARVLHSVHRGEESGLKQWCKYYGDAGFIDLMKYHGYIYEPMLTVSTLGALAKETDKAQYEQWHTKWVQEALNSLDGSNETIAEVLYRQHWLDYIFFRTPQEQWYMFKDHILHPCPSGDWDKHFDALPVSTTPEQRCVVLTYLSSGFFRRPLQGLSFSTQNSLLGTRNGVLDCSGDLHIRPGRSEDYVLQCIGTVYDFTYTLKNPQVCKILQWFNELFHTEEMVTYALTMCAAFLQPAGPQYKEMWWVGEKNSGKATFFTLIQRVLGTYANIPEMKGIPYKPRVLEYNASLLQDPENLHNTWIVHQCTDIGDVKPHSLVLPFRSAWVADAKQVDEKKHIYLADDAFIESVDLNAMLWLMIQYRVYYGTFGFVIPAEVQKPRLKVLDVVQKLIREHLVRKEGGSVNVRDVYAIYKTTYLSRAISTLRKFVMEMSPHLGVPNLAQQWVGWELKC